MAEEQLGLGRWLRRSSPPVQLWRGTGAPTGSYVRFLHAGLGHDLQWLVQDHGALLPHAVASLLESALGVVLSAEAVEAFDPVREVFVPM
eukprot:9878449-Alexandrium_andersonii.AAC.1